jgi:hypothetical protein
MFKIHATLLLTSSLIVLIPSILIASIFPEYDYQIIFKKLPNEINSTSSFIFISYWLAVCFYIFDTLGGWVFNSQVHRFVFAILVMYYIATARDYGYFMGFLLYLSTFIQSSIIVGVSNFVTLKILGNLEID